MLLDKVSVQMYSVRKVEDDFDGRLKRLAEMGFAGVELAGNALTPAEMNAAQLKYGIKVVSSHINHTKLLAEIDQHIEYNLAIGNHRLACSKAEMCDRDSALRVAEDLNRFGEKCKKNGMIFSYHNHAHEFVKDGDQYLLDILYANTDPGLVKVQFDVYWITRGGADPVEMINKYSGRVPTMHLKDGTAETQEMAVGEGPIDFPAIITAAKAAGTVEFIVETESKTDEYGVVSRSLNYLTK
ncbi:MAG: sugar phosphate isomerase/epimerase [Bacillota bacterium]|nr:sugar phosphate isomerase/epimerase [Bacillota bacterium]